MARRFVPDPLPPPNNSRGLLTDDELYTLRNPDSLEYVVTIIKEKLRNAEQKQWLDANDISIEESLTGRWEVTPARDKFMQEMFADWNRKCGEHQFGRYHGTRFENSK
jgi:hypothetical protein